MHFVSLLTSLSVSFLANSTIIQSNICAPLDIPIINSPVHRSAVATGTPVVIKGKASLDAAVTLSEADVTLITVTADQDSSFTVQLILDAGSHTIKVMASNACSNIGGDSITINALEPPTEATINPAQTKQTPPSIPSVSQDGLAFLRINPPNGTKTSQSSVYVSGLLNLPATVSASVNNEVVATSKIAATSFGLSVPLEIGENVVAITASAGGSETRQAFLVTRTVPVTDDTAPPLPWYRTILLTVLIGIAIIFAITVLWLLWLLFL